MYMSAPHDHEAWKAAKDAKQNSWKEQKEGRSPTKRKAPVETTAKTSAKKENLRLSNSFKSALCTQMMNSDGRSPTKRKAPVELTAKTSPKKENLRLSNSFKLALCTQMMTSDKEADEFVNAIMKVAELSDTSDKEPLK